MFHFCRCRREFPGKKNDKKNETETNVGIAWAHSSNLTKAFFSVLNESFAEIRFSFPTNFVKHSQNLRWRHRSSVGNTDFKCLLIIKCLSAKRQLIVFCFHKKYCYCVVRASVRSCGVEWMHDERLISIHLSFENVWIHWICENGAAENDGERGKERKRNYDHRLCDFIRYTIPEHTDTHSTQRNGRV